MYIYSFAYAVYTSRTLMTAVCLRSLSSHFIINSGAVGLPFQTNVLPVWKDALFQCGWSNPGSLVKKADVTWLGRLNEDKHNVITSTRYSQNFLNTLCYFCSCFKKTLSCFSSKCVYTCPVGRLVFERFITQVFHQTHISSSLADHLCII